jgi:hypothetical protein
MVEDLIRKHIGNIIGDWWSITNHQLLFLKIKRKISNLYKAANVSKLWKYRAIPQQGGNDFWLWHPPIDFLCALIKYSIVYPSRRISPGNHIKDGLEDIWLETRLSAIYIYAVCLVKQNKNRFSHRFCREWEKIREKTKTNETTTGKKQKDLRIYVCI